MRTALDPGELHASCGRIAAVQQDGVQRLPEHDERFEYAVDPASARSRAAHTGRNR